MPSPKRTPKRKPRHCAPKSRRKGGWRFPKPWPSAKWRKKILRAFKRAPFGVQLVLCLVLSAALALGVNWGYQVVRKPSELFFPVSDVLHKTPTETWETYAPIFRRHSTSSISPEFLAALAQVEASGNPIVRTYWRFSLSKRPFDIYKPASSAVGMYQITDGTFAEAKRYCIRNHVAIENGPLNKGKSCWFNSLYTRTIPSHAVEMTSAYLDIHVNKLLRRYGLRRATAQQKHNLAALIHLCGAGAGNLYARRGLSLAPGQRCGDHSAASYVAKMNSFKAVFRQLAASS